LKTNKGKKAKEVQKALILNHVLNKTKVKKNGRVKVRVRRRKRKRVAKVERNRVNLSIPLTPKLNPSTVIPVNNFQPLVSKIKIRV
jgi:hypothetical protein